MDKQVVVTAWGFGLLFAEGFASGDFKDLIAIIANKQQTGTHPGLGYRLIGETILIVVLILLSQWSDDGANLSMLFLLALTLLFFVSNSSTLSSFFGKTTGG